MLGRSRISNIKGTRKLVHRNQLLISLGLPALDIMIGGGLPVGNIFLVEDDEFGEYSKFLAKYYLAEGVMNDHQLLLASLDVKSEYWTTDLPDPLVVPVDKMRGGILDRLRFSKNKPLRRPDDECGRASTNCANDALAFGNTFGLNTHRGVMYRLMLKMKVNHWKYPTDTSTSTYENLYEHIEKTLDNSKYSFKLPSQERTVLRIAIISIGTGSWTGNIYRFLIRLRFLMRNVCATCFISIQPRLFDKKDMSRIEHLCDTVIQLEAFYNEQDGTNDDEYDGLIILKKLSSINTWAPTVKDTNDDWVFKLRRGSRFIVRKLQETTSPLPAKRIRTENND